MQITRQVGNSFKKKICTSHRFFWHKCQNRCLHKLFLCKMVYFLQCSSCSTTLYWKSLHSSLITTICCGCTPPWFLRLCACGSFCKVLILIWRMFPVKKMSLRTGCPEKNWSLQFPFYPCLLSLRRSKIVQFLPMFCNLLLSRMIKFPLLMKLSNWFTILVWVSLVLAVLGNP